VSLEKEIRDTNDESSVAAISPEHLHAARKLARIEHHPFSSSHSSSCLYFREIVGESQVVQLRALHPLVHVVTPAMLSHNARRTKYSSPSAPRATIVHA
jgi:hypothetical protein